jgi:hypothetical protein
LTYKRGKEVLGNRNIEEAKGGMMERKRELRNKEQGILGKKSRCGQESMEILEEEQRKINKQTNKQMNKLIIK